MLKGLTKSKVKTNHISLLFLSTISKNKGIYLVLNAFEILKNEFPQLNLIIAGKGPELSSIIDLIKRKDLKRNR